MIEGGDYTSSMAKRDRGWRLYVEGSSRGGDYTSRARRGVAIIRRGLVEGWRLYVEGSSRGGDYTSRARRGIESDFHFIYVWEICVVVSFCTLFLL